jgi:peptide/nickel transport system ATP-binding protein
VAGEILGIEGVSVHFRGRTVVKAVQDVSLTVRRGEIISLVGESGSGKTTLGRTIVGLTRPTEGRILMDGQEVVMKGRTGLKSLWRRVQMIFQDPYSTFNPLATIYESVATPIRKFGMAEGSEAVKALVDATLTKVGLNPAEVEGKYPHQLSGGQKQRASIARALTINPEVLVADEPVSMLDVSVRAGILDLLKNLRKEYNMAIVFITHDLAVADYLSDRIAVMYKGKVVELGTADQVIGTPLHPYTELLLKSAPRLDAKTSWTETQDLLLKQVPADYRGCNFYQRCPISQEGCTKAEPQLTGGAAGHPVSCFVRQESVGKSSQTA